ncbi:hypothetical protein [Microbacterium sorbitolivorans]|nr:hypothetical protein [Microbacterium sorbitolivorans]
MTQLYSLVSTAPTRGDVIDIADPDRRIWNALVMGEDADPLDRAIQHGARITAEAQGRFRPRMLEKSDYLSANLPIPLFSERLAAHVPGYACAITCKGKELTFVLPRIREYRDLLDPDATSWRTSSSGSRFPLSVVYRGDASDDFLLARDRTYPSMVLASQAFVDLCAAERLNIDFAPVTMSA